MKVLKKLSKRNTTSCDIRSNFRSGQKLISKNNSKMPLVLYNQETTTRASGQEPDKNDPQKESGEGFYLSKSRPLDLSSEWERTKQIGILSNLKNLNPKNKDNIEYSSNRDNNLNFYEASEDQNLDLNSLSKKLISNNQIEFNKSEELEIWKPKKLKPLCNFNDQISEEKIYLKSPKHRSPKIPSSQKNQPYKKHLKSKNFFDEPDYKNKINQTESSTEKSAKLFAEQRSSLRSSFKDFNKRQNYKRMGKSVRDISLKVNRNTSEKQNLMYKERGTSQTQLVMQSSLNQGLMNIYTTQNATQKQKIINPKPQKYKKFSDFESEDALLKKVKKKSDAKKLQQIKSQKEIHLRKGGKDRRRKKNHSRIRKDVGSISKKNNNIIDRKFENIKKNFGLTGQDKRETKNKDRLKKKKKKNSKAFKASKKMGFKKFFKELQDKKHKKFAIPQASLSQYSSLNYSRGQKQKSFKELDQSSKEIQKASSDIEETQINMENKEMKKKYKEESQLITIETKIKDISKPAITHYGFKSELISVPTSNSKLEKSRDNIHSDSKSNPKILHPSPLPNLTTQRTGSAFELRAEPNKNLKPAAEKHRVLTFASVIDLKNNTSEPASIKKPFRIRAPPIRKKAKKQDFKLGTLKTISHTRGYAHIRNKSSTTFVDVNYKLQAARAGSKKSAGPDPNRLKKERLSDYRRRGSVRDLKIKEYDGIICSDEERNPKPKNFLEERNRLKRKKTLDKQIRQKNNKFLMPTGIFKGQTFNSILEEEKNAKSHLDILKESYNKEKKQKSVDRPNNIKEKKVSKQEKDLAPTDKNEQKSKKKFNKKKNLDLKKMSKEILSNLKSKSKLTDGYKTKMTHQRPYFGSRDKDPIIKNIKNFSKKSEKKFNNFEPRVKRHGQLEMKEQYPIPTISVLSSRVLRKDCRKTETSPSHILRKNRMIVLPKAERKTKREAHSKSKYRISRDLRNLPSQPQEPFKEKEILKSKIPEQLNFLEFEPKKNLTSNKFNQKSKNDFQKGGAFEKFRKSSMNIDPEIKIEPNSQILESPIRLRKIQHSKQLMNTNEKGKTKNIQIKKKSEILKAKKRQMRFKNNLKSKNLGFKIPFSPKHKNEKIKIVNQDLKKKSNQGKTSAKNLVRNFCKVSYFEFKNQKNSMKDLKKGKTKRKRNKEIDKIEEISEPHPLQRNFSVNKASKRQFCEK